MSLAMLAAAVVGCRTMPGDELPPFVRQLIERYETSPTANPPASIWKYRYDGAEVFYVPPRCCDIPGELYDRSGTLICAPDGGLTGAGDGQCPDFFTERADESLIWRDERGDTAN